MNVEYHEWNSIRLDAKAQIKVYGYWGFPLLVFPCAGGSFFEFEDFGMVETIREFIEAGKLKVFTVQSWDSKSWLNNSISFSERARNHEIYVDYITSEVVPFIHSHMGGKQGITAFGCSLGAMHSLSFALRFPEIFTSVIALSGIYRLSRLVGDYKDELTVRSSPIDFLESLIEGPLIQKIRENSLTICCGQGAWENESLEDTLALPPLFEKRAIPAWIDLWGKDVSHDWPWWRKQLPYFIQKCVEKNNKRNMSH
ncbi:MAG: esterase family protein [Candidatus Riflebacteria bacterium]|nr:esterase family protein [Candidatus Riflebacteria bacterium]